jgi:hypothetical protein
VKRRRVRSRNFKNEEFTPALSRSTTENKEYSNNVKGRGKGKVTPLQARFGAEGG